MWWHHFTWMNRLRCKISLRSDPPVLINPNCSGKAFALPVAHTCKMPRTGPWPPKMAQHQTLVLPHTGSRNKARLSSQEPRSRTRPKLYRGPRTLKAPTQPSATSEGLDIAAIIQQAPRARRHRHGQTQRRDHPQAAPPSATTTA